MAWVAFTKLMNFIDRVANVDSNSADDFNTVKDAIDELGGNSGSAPTKTVTENTTDIATIQNQLGNSKNVDNTNYTILDDDGFDKFYLDGSSGTCTVTLPTLAANQDRNLLFIVIDDTNLCKIDGEGAETINALLEIELPKAGDHVQIIGQASEWKIINENITSQLRVHTSDGGGSTDTKIEKFTTAVDDYGNCFTHNHGSYGTAGLEITIAKAGKYAFKYSSNTNIADHMGLSLNSTQLTTNVVTITPADILSAGYVQASTANDHVSWVGYLDVGDIVRPHWGGYNPGAASDAVCGFTATYLGS